MKAFIRFTVCLNIMMGMLVNVDRAQAQSSPKKYALLVGINEYDHDKLPKLDYAVNDATKLGELLKKHGYEVRVLTDETSEKPTKKIIEGALDDILEKYQKGDTVIIGYAGHGLQFGKDCYFCPKNGKPFEDETKTLVSLTAVYKKLEKTYSGVKLVLVDACRDDGQRGIRGNAEDAPLPPKGVGVLLSCSDGEKASESEKLGHGVFFYHVIKGLGGEAKDQNDLVTWDGLRTYVKTQVPSQVGKLFPDMRKQNPNEIGNLSGVPPVLVTLTNGKKGVTTRLDSDREWMEQIRPDQPLKLSSVSTVVRKTQFTRDNRWFVALARGDGEENATPDDENTKRPELYIWDLSAGGTVRRYTIRSGVA